VAGDGGDDGTDASGHGAEPGGPTVAIVAIGDEILAGDTLNTNAHWLAGELDDLGATLDRITVIGDDPVVIAEVVESERDRVDRVIVTGGLGPTHDDLTGAAVADVFGVPVEEHEAALARIQERYPHKDLWEGTGHIPRGATPLDNPDGVAPGFVLDDVYVLPGVPDEMKAIWPAVADDFAGGERHTAFVYTQEPERLLVDVLDAFRERFEDCRLGSYPEDGRVRLKVTGADEARVSAAADWLREQVDCE
jgi:molybdenum cofactor synthesis domain-containing protein